MIIKVGTFNLNNLFSRFNFSGAIKEIQSASGAAGAVTVRYEFTDPDNIRIRTFLGKLVRAKSAKDTGRVAQRIVAMDLDVLAVQEVENIEILREFNRDNLGGLYPFQVLIEGNDPRFIDVGVLSKLPIGAVTSFQTTVHPADPGRRIFSRDLLEVEVLNPPRSQRLFMLYNNHLKSHFGDDDNGGQGKDENDLRRTRQAEMIGDIVSSRMRSDSRFMITGDMNDPPEAAPLAPMLSIDNKPLINGLANPVESQPPKPDPGGHDPASAAWTHRFKESGQPAEYELFDQIWLSEALGPRLGAAFIDRRTNLTGDGSDHDPAWVELDLP
jgi:endonuclease/exonuclease/phosphatase family metal-dependent hydrolase